MELNKETYRLAFIFYLLDKIKKIITEFSDNEIVSAKEIDGYHTKLNLSEDEKVSGRHVMRLIYNENDAWKKTKKETLSKLGRIYGGDINSCNIFKKEYLTNEYLANEEYKNIVRNVKQAIKYLSSSPPNHSSRNDGAFLGIWKGVLKGTSYSTENKPVKPNKEFVGYEVSFEIKVKKDIEIAGTIEIFYHDYPKEESRYQISSFSGEIIYNSLLYIEFKNTESSLLHFGSMLLKLDAIGNTLMGAFLGYEKASGLTVHGEAILYKDIDKNTKQAIKYLSPSTPKHSSRNRNNSTFLGIWEGCSKEKKYTIENNQSVEKDEFIEYEISFEIKAKKKNEVTGTIEIFYHDQQNKYQSFSFSGSVISNSLLYLEYKNINPNSFHFGSILFKLNALGDTLIGTFLGYGIIAERIVHGEVVAHKQKSDF